MQKYHNNIQSSTGQAIVAAVVRVFNAGTVNLATIYEDNEVTPKTQPLTTDSNGEFSFKAADGVYDIVVAAGVGYEARTYSEILIEDATKDLAASSGSSLVGFIQSGAGARAEDMQGVIRRLPFVNLLSFCSVAKRASILAGTQTDVTAELTLAAATGKPIWGPYGQYELISPVTVSSDMMFEGMDTNQSQFILTGTGQLIVGDQFIHWRGFEVNSAVNNLTFVKVSDASNYFRFDNFKILGTGTGQVGIEMAATTTGLAHCTFEKFLIKTATSFKTTGAGYVNNNKFGDRGDSWQSATQFLDVQNTGGFQVNGIGGYCEHSAATSFLKIAASCTVSNNEFRVWLDKPSGTMNSVDNAGTLGRNTWIGLPPDQWQQTGAGSFSAQEFTAKITAAVSRNADQIGVGDATFTKIAFDTETYDPWAVMSSGTFTAKRAAKIHIAAQMHMGTNLDDQDSVYISIYKNGAEMTRHKIIISGSSGTYAAVNRTIEVVKDDTIEIFARGDQAAANDNHIITGSALISFFTVEEV